LRTAAAILGLVDAVAVDLAVALLAANDERVQLAFPLARSAAVSGSADPIAVEPH
jgi:hypothetical protein